MSVHLIYLVALGMVALVVVAIVLGVAAWLIGHESGDSTHRSGRHLWPGMHHTVAAYLDDKYGPRKGTRYVPAPVASSPLALTVPAGAGTSSLDDRAWWETASRVAPVPGPVVEHHIAPRHAIEVHPVQYWAGQYRDGLNARTGCWPMGDGDLTESAWTRRDAITLQILDARTALDDGFDHIVAYATSGLAPRWTEVA